MRQVINFILGFAFLTTSYGQSNNIATNKTKKETSINLANINIFGVWTNCTTSSDGVIITANSCKIIEFKSDNSATITYPSQEKQLVNWTMTDDLLVINLTKNKDDKINRTLTDIFYEVHLTEDSMGFNLVIKAKNKDVIYYLKRQK
jgi:hypothetical protein